MAYFDIYRSQGCPFALRTPMVHIEKDHPFNLADVDLENKPDWPEIHIEQRKQMMSAA